MKSERGMAGDLAKGLELIIKGLVQGLSEFPNGVKQYFTDERIQSQSSLERGLKFVPHLFLAFFAGFGAWFSAAGDLVEEEFPRVRKNAEFQNALLVFLLLLSTIIALLRPTTSAEAQRFFIADLILTICIFAMMAIALNLQTGTTGIVNFGVIFFVGVGGITTGIVTTRYGWPPFLGMLLGMFISGLIGYLLAYPSLKLRSDYFAIITLSLGEVLRRMMLAETFLQTEQPYGYSVGISSIPSPLENIVPSSLQVYLQAILAIIALVIVYFIANRLVHSPYGRVMRSIREDEEVVESYGYNIFSYKASILAIGGALFAIPGAFIVWRQQAITPGTINVVTTFFVWGAFIIGGKGNNKGMIAGATIIVLTRNIVRALGAVDRDQSIILTLIDGIYRFIVVTIGGTIFGDGTWNGQASEPSGIIVDLTILQVFLVGLIIIIAMNKFDEGLIPELPYLIDKEEAIQVERSTTSPDPLEVENQKLPSESGETPNTTKEDTS